MNFQISKFRIHDFDFCQVQNCFRGFHGSGIQRKYSNFCLKQHLWFFDHFCRFLTGLSKTFQTLSSSHVKNFQEVDYMIRDAWTLKKTIRVNQVRNLTTFAFRHFFSKQRLWFSGSQKPKKIFLSQVFSEGLFRGFWGC